MRAATFVLGLVLAVPRSAAAPPDEVPADARFESDRTTLTWSAVAGATSYHVYAGTEPSAHDQACRVYASAGTSASIAEVPPSGALRFYLVTAANAEGEGTLGADSAGTPRPNAAPCIDGDGDAVADNLDNCPAAANTAQADQDGNGVGDRCDPRTYDFEADPIGAPPAGTTRLGPPSQALAVQDLSLIHI